MSIGEFLGEINWIKFIPVYFILVIVPIFFLDFTDSLGFGRKIIFMIGGAVGVGLALNGKTLRAKKYQK